MPPLPRRLCTGGFRQSPRSGYGIAAVLQQWPLQHQRDRSVSIRQRRSEVHHQQSARHGQVQAAHTSQHRADGAVHARWQIADLDGTFEHYRTGGRDLKIGSYAGDGSASARTSELPHVFFPDGSERADFLEFMPSLTDEEFVPNPDHANPWPAGSLAHGVTPTHYSGTHLE
ncbi:MAG: hypothetical protein RL385_4147 [Pseudomonadota bacterium]